MELAAQIIGYIAVVLFLLSYLQKTRLRIIGFNFTSRILYIVQYLMLGAFSGAVLDVLGAISSLVASKKNVGFVKRYAKAIVILLDASMVVAGILLYENIFSILPVLGVLFHTTAFWIDDERIIRIVSLIGSPFWLVYNFVSRAYGSAVGDALTIASIIVAMVKYRKGTSSEKIDKIKENV